MLSRVTLFTAVPNYNWPTFPTAKKKQIPVDRRTTSKKRHKSNKKKQIKSTIPAQINLDLISRTIYDLSNYFQRRSLSGWSREDEIYFAPFFFVCYLCAGNAIFGEAGSKAGLHQYVRPDNVLALVALISALIVDKVSHVV